MGRKEELNRPSNRKKSGFTLLEVMVVLVLIALITTVAVPVAGRGIHTMRLQSVARDISATLRFARAKAIRQQEVYFVNFNLEDNRVTVGSGNQTYQRSFDLPQDVSLQKAVLLNTDTEPVSPRPRNMAFFFSPNGMSQAFEVRITNVRGRSLRVVQSAFHRSPRIEAVRTGED